MEQCIPKSTLVEKIENLVNIYKKCQTRNFYEEGLKDGRLLAYEDALYEIDTLEVKEVDWEKEWKEFLKNGDIGFKEVAKHFFELGLKAQKGEKV